MEQSYKKRIRVNYSMSVKGIVTPDITVEMIDTDKLEVLTEAKDILVLAQAVAKEKSLN